MPRPTRRKRKVRHSPPGRLRIVAGKWRSRVLPVADIDGLRPTAERVRETLFNWLSPVIDDMRCLDLYAGSGALGLEALSRGAKSVVFVEQAPEAVATLRESIRLLAAEDTTVHAGDAVEFLRHATAKRFDLVLLDPPFADDLVPDLCRLLVERGWLASGAYVYLEQDASKPRPELPPGFVAEKEKQAGNVRFTLFRHATAEDGE